MPSPDSADTYLMGLEPSSSDGPYWGKPCTTSHCSDQQKLKENKVP